MFTPLFSGRFLPVPSSFSRVGFGQARVPVRVADALAGVVARFALAEIAGEFECDEIPEVVPLGLFRVAEAPGVGIASGRG